MNDGKEQEVSYLNIVFGRKLEIKEYDRIFNYLDDNITNDYCGIVKQKEKNATQFLFELLSTDDCPASVLKSDVLMDLADYLVERLR